jgi:meiotically up-regulated gene 157 (Mug157) protein
MKITAKTLSTFAALLSATAITHATPVISADYAAKTRPETQSETQSETRPETRPKTRLETRPPTLDYTVTNRPPVEERLFTSQAIEAEIERIKALLTNPQLRWMFENCFPNTLDTTVRYYATKNENGEEIPDTVVYTGDIHAMWLRDSGAQVWPYIQFATQDPELQRMLAGVIRRQFASIILDPYANAFLDPHDPAPDHQWMGDYTTMRPELHERKWEIDSLCYPLRLAYEYWLVTGDESIFDEQWLAAIENILKTLKDQQRKDNHGSYRFMRETARGTDTMVNGGWGNPVNPVGLIASAFRPSDDATTLLFLVPSNFFAVTSLRKAAEILTKVNGDTARAWECTDLADEVEKALQRHAIVDHPKYGKIYAYEVDGFGGRILMDDANVPSLLAMPYLGDVAADDPVYRNTRRFVLSADNPWFFSGTAGEGVGGPHIGYDMIWPMSIMMRAFTSTDESEIKACIEMLLATDAGTGFMHESFHKDDPARFTRAWFAWQNTLFGELILKQVNEGRLEMLNSIE